jgi:hypothetical protein
MDSSTIKARKSVRTFNDRPIPDELMAKLEDFTKHDTNPFGVPITFKFLDRKRDGVSSPVIVGANTYVAAKYHRQEDAELGFGYSFERFVLLATSLGLGSVWLAATIDRKAFERALGVGADEVMPAVTPLGYAADKRSVRETLMRKNMRSENIPATPATRNSSEGMAVTWARTATRDHLARSTTSAMTASTKPTGIR